MSYQIHITSTAEHDIMRAADYIEFVLKNPDAADNLLDVATEQIGSLANLPQKFRLVDDPVLFSVTGHRLNNICLHQIGKKFWFYLVVCEYP